MIGQRGVLPAGKFCAVHFMQTISSLVPNENWQELVGEKKGRCLDLGCGYGADSFWFANHGWQVDAVDYNDELRFCHPNLNFIKADLRRIDLLSLGKYDFIITCHILHYFKPSFSLNLAKYLYYMLKEGGILYIKIFEERFSAQLEDFFKNAKVERYEQADDHLPEGKHIHHVVKIICQK